MSFQSGVYGQYPQGPPQGPAASQPYRQQSRRPDVVPCLASNSGVLVCFVIECDRQTA